VNGPHPRQFDGPNPDRAQFKGEHGLLCSALWFLSRKQGKTRRSPEGDNSSIANHTVARRESSRLLLEAAYHRRKVISPVAQNKPSRANGGLADHLRRAGRQGTRGYGDFFPLKLQLSEIRSTGSGDLPLLDPQHHAGE